jgi:general secretion pathway protein K
MRRFAHLARRRPAGAASDQRGVALVLTLLVVVLLTAMILDFDFRTRLDLRAAGNFRDDARAYLLASSAVDVARALLREDMQVSQDHDGRDEDWALFTGSWPVPSIPDAVVTAQIADEGGKLDLNTLLTDDGKDQKTRIDIYRRLLEIVLEDSEEGEDYVPDELVDALLDWMDENAEARALGAEGPEYASLDPPYRCGDRRLRTLDELRLVKGYTPWLVERLRPHVTAIWTGTIVPTKGGLAQRGRININTATPELLTALHPDMDFEMAEDIRDQIDGQPPAPFTQMSTQILDQVPSLNVAGVSQYLAKELGVTSDVFSVQVTVQLGDPGASGAPRTSRTVSALLRRQLSGPPRDRVRVLAWRTGAVS